MPKRNKFGVKQRVLKNSGSVKKRKAFKGIRSIERMPKMPPRDQEWGFLSFVGEDDVISEQIPEPLTSVSSRKLQESDDESGYDASFSSQMPVAHGYRFVHMDSKLS